jgi:hypothetical protein
VIPKSGHRFSEKITRKAIAAMLRFSAAVRA